MPEMRLRRAPPSHLVKSCMRATKKKEAQDEPEDEEDQEKADDAELDPGNDDFELVDPDEYSVET
eukprot:5131373-Amphidinium_carterae.1